VSFSYLSHYSFTKCKILSERNFLRYFLVCTAYIVLLLFAFDHRFTFVVNSLWLLPQIVQNASIGGRSKLYPWFNAVICFNQIYIVYLLGCSENIYQVEPRYTELMAVLAVLLFQWVVLYLQSTQGGRFFVPNQLIPGYHKYIVTVKRGTTPSMELCSICLERLQDHHSLSSAVGNLTDLENSDIITAPAEDSIQVMVTPCKHYFHVHCLSSWMEIKDYCPVDRSKLPPR